LSSPIARITSDKKLKLKGNLYTTQDAYDYTTQFDDAYQFDDTYQIDDNAEIFTLFNYLLGIENTSTQVDKFYIDNRGNLVTPEVYTIWQGFDGSENIDTTIELNTEHSIDSSLGTEEFISYLFGGLTVEDISINKFKILSNKKLLVNEVLESQIL